MIYGLNFSDQKKKKKKNRGWTIKKKEQGEENKMIGSKDSSARSVWIRKEEDITYINL